MQYRDARSALRRITKLIDGYIARFQSVALWRDARSAESNTVYMDRNQIDVELQLDQGDIRGGFPHDYDARIVPAANTPILRAIERSTGVRRERSLTVEIVTESGLRTIGFTCDDWHNGLTPCVFTTPNRRVVGVRLQGCAYIASVHSNETQTLPITPLMAAASDRDRGVMFFADYTKVGAFSGTDFLWVSDRVALDGIMRLGYDDGIVHGLAEVGGDKVLPFTINADTGIVRGGFREQFPDWPGLV